MVKRFFVLLVVFAAATFSLRAQGMAVKTNLLYWATTTPNLGVEVALGERSTLDLGVGYNPWKLNSDDPDNRKMVHWLTNLEYRRWLCRKFGGHFFGVHALGGEFNISHRDMPWLLGRESEKYRYQGWMIGGGVSYGYQFVLSRRWNLETSVGVGYARLNYDRYYCEKCGASIDSGGRNYWGVTKASVSLMYLF